MTKNEENGEKNKISHFHILAIAIGVLFLIAFISTEFGGEITGSVTKQPHFVSISSVDFSTPQENPLISAYNKLYLVAYTDDLKQEYYIYDGEDNYVDRIITRGDVTKGLRAESEGCVKSSDRPDYRYLCKISKNLPLLENSKPGQFYLVPKVKGKLGKDKILFRYVK